MYFTLLPLLLLHYATYVQCSSSIKYLGCYKYIRKPIGCQLDSEKGQLQLSNKLTRAIANGVEWLRQEQKSKLWFDIPTTSYVLEHLVSAGYINDGGICSNTIQNAVVKINLSLQDVSGISAGELARIMIGMKATCQDVNNFKHQNLVEILTDKMENFPEDDFNNYYQYSLGVIALSVNGADIPSSFSRRILKELSTSKRHGIKSNPKHMDDTEALMLVALTAITNQDEVTGDILKQGKQVFRDALKKIDRIMETSELKNLVTITHVLQVLQAQGIPLSRKPYCKKTLDWILKSQDKFGSFGGLMPTAGVLPLLSGFSIKELREMKCPVPKDTVDEELIEDFISSRIIKKPTAAVETEKVKISITLTSDVEGVSINGRSTVSILKGATALDGLTEASKYDPCFKFRVKQTVWGPFIEMICNVENNKRDKLYWMFYVNGKMAEVGAGGYKVQDNDHINFKYMKV